MLNNLYEYYNYMFDTKEFFESSFGYQDLNKLILLLNKHFTHSIAINVNN